MPTHARVADAPLAEFTVKAVVAGVVLGIIFGAANAYLGLRVGLTVSASIPAAVMTVAIFRLFRVRGTILEANLSQTIGSASTSLASGTIFTIPALFMWNMAPPYLQVVVLAYLGAILGLAAMIPLRRLLIVQSHDELPFPGRNGMRRSAARDGGRIICERVDLQRHGAGRCRQACRLAGVPDTRQRARAAACRAQGGAGARARARTARGRFHPRLQTIGRPRRRFSAVGDRVDADHRPHRSGARRAPRTGADKARGRHERQ